MAHKCQRPENPQHNNLKLLCSGFLGNTTKWNCCVVDVPTTQRKLEGKYSLESTDPRESEIRAPPQLELGRYRFFKSVSVFVFLVGFFKSRYRFRFRFFKISRYRFQFSVFPHEPTTCLSNNTIADTLRHPFSPKWGLGPRICITNCGHKR